MRSMARLLKVASELPVEVPSAPTSRLVEPPLPTVPLSGSCTSCASSRHTCLHIAPPLKLMPQPVGTWLLCKHELEAPVQNQLSKAS